MTPTQRSAPRLLDPFSGAGGAAMGYSRAGFEIVGVDIEAQPNYPFEFIRADALEWAREWGRIRDFDVVHASPPCQHYSRATAWRGDRTNHPDLIPATRGLLVEAGLPYVIENVREARLHASLMLCGTMFELGLRRHRYFESNMPFGFTPQCQHRPTDRVFLHKQERAYGDAMGCGWMVRDEHREAIPPAFTEFIGRQILDVLEGEAVVNA